MLFSFGAEHATNLFPSGVRRCPSQPCRQAGVPALQRLQSCAGCQSAEHPLMMAGWQMAGQLAGRPQGQQQRLIQKVLIEHQSQRPMMGCQTGWHAAGQPEGSGRGLR